MCWGRGYVSQLTQRLIRLADLLPFLLPLLLRLLNLLLRDKRLQYRYLRHGLTLAQRCLGLNCEGLGTSHSKSVFSFPDYPSGRDESTRQRSAVAHAPFQVPRKGQQSLRLCSASPMPQAPLEIALPRRQPVGSSGG